jgi:biotin transport system permease protein/energy-coupling factor transport system permease protein
VIYYAILLVIAKIIGSLAQAISSSTLYWPDFYQFVFIARSFFIAEKETWLLLLKLFCVMPSASLVFKTSTSLQLREGLEKIELTIRKFLHLKTKKTGAQKAPVAQTLSIFICFIPQVSKNWQQSTRAWKARGGKKSLRMLVVLLPVFFSVGMKQAYNSARAISIRQ